MHKKHKMYCLIRRDLKPSYQACQGGHAIAEYFITHGKHETWDNGTMIYLKIKNETQLLKIKSELEKDGIKCSSFIEPDIGHEHTALTCIDTGERFKKFSLL